MAASFSTPQWAYGANVYEVNIRQYTPEGTFQAFSTHLPRLAEMGVSIIWLMPVTPISVDGRKGSLGSYYACSSYVQINPEFGTMQDLESLVRQAHSLNIKVLIDWVANHTGRDHEWTLAHPDFFKRNSAGRFYDAHGWDDVIDLDYANETLWQSMVTAMRHWIDTCGIDGFRCDMAHLVPLDFWRYARTELDTAKPLLWLAETENKAYHDVFDATYSWELLHAMEQRYKGALSVWQLADVLVRYDQVFPKNALRLFFTSNHDENSHSGSEWERMGNGAPAFAVLCATWMNSLPLIYSGQELPNSKRLLFFDKDNIEWTGENQLHHFYQKLLTLRREHAVFTYENAAVHTHMLPNNLPADVFAFMRSIHEKELLVVLNLSPHEHTVTIQEQLSDAHRVELFTGEALNGQTLHMDAWAYRVFVKQH